MSENTQYLAYLIKKDELLGNDVMIGQCAFDTKEEAIADIKAFMNSMDITTNCDIKVIELDPDLKELYLSEYTTPPKILPELSTEKKELLYKAKKIAFDAHQGQVDKNGTPYIEHPLIVSSNCRTYEAKVVGLLHDVIEDTNITYDDLRKEGFDEELLEALRCVTKEPGYNTKEYLERIKNNPIAKEVKMQDLIHNYDLNRIVNVTDFNRLKSSLYGLELDFLQGKIEYPETKINIITSGLKDIKFKIKTEIDIVNDLLAAQNISKEQQKELM